METENPLELAELKELDSRKADKLLITLWWVKNTMHTYVEVIDLKTEPPTVTEIPVLEGQRAADVYNHPYVYLENAK